MLLVATASLSGDRGSKELEWIDGSARGNKKRFCRGAWYTVQRVERSCCCPWESTLQPSGYSVLRGILHCKVCLAACFSTPFQDKLCYVTAPFSWVEDWYSWISFRRGRGYNSCSRALPCHRVRNRLPVWQELTSTSSWTDTNRTSGSQRGTGGSCFWTTQVYAITWLKHELGTWFSGS